MIDSYAVLGLSEPCEALDLEQNGAYSWSACSTIFWKLFFRFADYFALLLEWN